MSASIWNPCVDEDSGAGWYYSSNFPTLQEALTAATGGRLVLTQDYSITTGVVVPADTWVWAYGQVITCTTQVKAITFTNGGGWFGGEIIGPTGTVFGATGFGMWASGIDNSPLAPTFITGPEIRDVTIHGFNNAGIYVSFTLESNVTFNTVYDCGYVGIGGISSKYTHFDNNTVHGIKGTGVTNWYGIFFSALENSDVGNPQSDYISACFNTVYDIPGWEGIDIHGSLDFHAIGNTIYDCKMPLMLGGGDILGVLTRGPKRVIATNNIITGTGLGSGIVVHGASTDFAEHVIVANNIVKNCGIPNNVNEGAIRLYNINELELTGNIITFPVMFGINLSFDIRNAIVSKNIITDPIDSVHTTPACIYVGSNNIVALIVNNNFEYRSAGSGTFVAVRSIDIAAALTGLNITIGYNKLIGIDATHLTYVPGTLTGVQSSGFGTQTGSTALVAGTIAVVFPVRMPTATPLIKGLTCGANETLRWSGISATGFTITSSNGASTTTVHWEAGL